MEQLLLGQGLRSFIKYSLLAKVGDNWTQLYNADVKDRLLKLFSS